MRALLFDLDGTLTWSRGEGSQALGRALHARPKAVGELQRMRLDGMTDRGIARILLAAEGDPAVPVADRARAVQEAEIDAVLARYLDELARACAGGAYRALPGVPALLDRLALEKQVLLGLCTGNLERGAQLKLASAGLAGRFAFGGFADDAELRVGIVRAAWQRAQALGATEGLVIGDTPRDVAAAHEAGLPAFGVATGHYSVHELAENGADLVAADFSDLDASLTLLLAAR